MLSALADLKTYQAANQLTNDELLALADLNGDGQTTNADIQGLLALLSGGCRQRIDHRRARAGFDFIAGNRRVDVATRAVRYLGPR